MKAIKTFNPARGATLSYYASLCIKWRMVKYMQYHSRDLRHPPKIQKLLINFPMVVKTLSHELGREPDDDEIREALGITKRTYKNLLTAFNQKVISLDDERPGYDGEADLHDAVADNRSKPPPHLYELDELRQTVNEQLAVLINNSLIKPIELTVLNYCCGLGFVDGSKRGEVLSIKEIAEKLKITETRVKQHLTRAIRALREPSIIEKLKIYFYQ